MSPFPPIGANLQSGTMRVLLPAAILLALSALLTGCSRTLHTQDVIEFVDKADDAARKRFAPEICGLRGENFTLSVNFQGHQDRYPPSKIEMNRKLFCSEAGKFARLRQYRLERKSMDISLANDRKSATVKATYVETLPYYDPDMIPLTPDDFREWQIVETRDESIVGIEDGDLVFLSTRSDAVQTLTPKNQISLPED
jgi:hypothetical protein